MRNFISRSIATAAALALLAGAALAGATPAAAAGECTQLLTAPINRTLIAVGNPADNPVRPTPSDRSAPAVGTLTVGTEYQVTAAFKCSDGWSVSQVAVTIGGNRGYTDATAFSENPTDLVFDRIVAFDAGLFGMGGNIYQYPSGKATKIGTLDRDTRYPATTVQVAGTARATGSGMYIAVQLADGRTGWVDIQSVVDGTDFGKGTSTITLVKMVVSEYGHGAPVIKPFTQPDPNAETHLLAGKGTEIGTLTAGDKYDAVPGAFEGQSFSPLGIFADALAKTFAKDEAANELEGKWSLIVHGDQLVWVPAWAIDTPQTFAQKAKDKLAKAKEWAGGNYDGLKDKWDERKVANNEPSLFTWLAMIPSGAAALAALILAGFAFSLRLRPMFDVVGKVLGWAGLVLAPIAGVLAITWLPAKAPGWAVPAGILLILITLLPAALLVRRLIKRAKKVTGKVSAALNKPADAPAPEPTPAAPVSAPLAAPQAPEPDDNTWG